MTEEQMGEEGLEEGRLHELAERLKQERDELKLKLRLGTADLRDEWDELEEKWSGLRGKLKQVADAADEAGDDIKTAARLLADELKEGYDSVRKRL
jgi:uncharacterized coiled-coil DUF342 family protein